MVRSGIAVNGIPCGGFSRETLVVLVYGFSFEALLVIAMVGALAPLATIVNLRSDTFASMLISRFTKRKIGV
jgi:hypothetical protein